MNHEAAEITQSVGDAFTVLFSIREHRFDDSNVSPLPISQYYERKEELVSVCDGTLPAFDGDARTLRFLCFGAKHHVSCTEYFPCLPICLDNLYAPSFHTSSEELHIHGHIAADVGFRWQHIHTDVRGNGDITTHYRFVHGFWGVPDDILIKYSCLRGIGAVAGPVSIGLRVFLIDVSAQPFFACNVS